jgi:hypothetical protein
MEPMLTQETCNKITFHGACGAFSFVACAPFPAIFSTYAVSGSLGVLK